MKQRVETMLSAERTLLAFVEDKLHRAEVSVPRYVVVVVVVAVVVVMVLCRNESQKVLIKNVSCGHC